MRRFVVIFVVTVTSGLVALAGGAPSVSAATPPAHRVITDPLLDGGPLRPFRVPTPTPSMEDIVAGFITEDSEWIHFTLEVDDLVEIPSPVAFASWFWEFTFAPAGQQPIPCGLPGNRCVQLRATSTGRTQMTGNCSAPTGGPSLVSCKPVPEAVVKVAFDYDADEVTISARRIDLGQPADGGTLHEVELFEGIAAGTGVGTQWAGNMDTVDLDDGFYVLGTNR